MRIKYLKGGGIAAVALSLTTLVAWRAPDQRAAAGPTVTVAAAAPAPAAVPVASYAGVVDKVMPAVVTVRIEKRAAAVPTGADDLFEQFFGPRFRTPRGVERGLGSGVIVSGDGYILTNNHVVDGAEEVKVELPDKRSFTAKVVGTDPPSDLAVIKIDASDLPTLTLGNSDAVRVGDVVLAIGNPLGVGETVTSGIISAKGRTTGIGDGSYEDFLQTDAPINRGNSGGALVNASGDLIGINSQIMTPTGGNIGLGFAIPVNMAKHVMTELIEHGSVQRARLGVTVQSVTSDIAASLGLPSAKGALVNSVEEGSPAAHAGIRQGDVITRFNGEEIADGNALRNEVASSKPGATVPLEIVRDGDTRSVNATLATLKTRMDRSDDRGEDGTRSGKFGMTVQPLTPDLAQRAGVPSGTRGVLVVDVDPAGRAADANLRPGDVIEKVDGRAVTTTSALSDALDATPDKPALLLVNREGASFFATL
jgi:Do/DeqQ family serine protease